MTKKKTIKKEKTMTLFFETSKDAEFVKTFLGETKRRVMSMNSGNEIGLYSRITGHYGSIHDSGNVFQVNINYKLIIPAPLFSSLTFDEKNQLKILDGDSTSWIVQ